MTGASAAAPSRRSDAEKNRARILVAAGELLAISGDASMQSIKKRAGVGQATMYRHFPSRESLVLTLHRNAVHELVECAPTLIQEHPPVEALRMWFDRLASYGRIKHGLAGALHSVMRAQLADEGYGSVVDAVAQLLDACKNAGAIRPDVDAEEVLLLVGFLWRIDSDPDWETRSSRMLDLVMDGLRVPASGPARPDGSAEPVP
jgi:AcrR family transcriptional regulator